ncbi:MAG: hypothetical protein GY787_03925 [Alteromonadales bacterium]|nr:hypothetical protein [Alteromonadales bacterium]
MLKHLLLLIFLSSAAFADATSYWELEVPIMKGAKNIHKEKDEKHYIVTTSYDLEITNTQDTYTFYEKYFESLGWENPFKNHPGIGDEDKFRGKWNSFRSGFNKHEKPESLYSSIWKSKSIPASGNVVLKLTGFKNNKFAATVEVSITPVIDQSSFAGIFELLNNPVNLFTLSEATGGNPYSIDSIDLEIPSKYQNNEVVKKYYAVIQGISKKYQEFGKQYVHK